MSYPHIIFGTTGDQFSGSNLTPATVAASQGVTLGHPMMFDDGRVYRWARAAATNIATARLCQQTLNDANFDELVVPAAVAAGARTFNITNGATTVALGDFDDGWLNVEDDAGEGHLYRIRTHAAESAGSADFSVTIYETVQVAWTTATTVGLFRNPYGRAIIHPSPATAMLIGETVLALTASRYGWLQTRGPASCLVEGTHVINERTIDSASADGAQAPTASTAAGEEYYVGIVMEVAATTEEGIVNLRME